jgi:hypothetical protein
MKTVSIMTSTEVPLFPLFAWACLLVLLCTAAFVLKRSFAKDTAYRILLAVWLIHLCVTSFCVATMTAWLLLSEFPLSFGQMRLLIVNAVSATAYLAAASSALAAWLTYRLLVKAK